MNRHISGAILVVYNYRRTTAQVQFVPAWRQRWSDSLPQPHQCQTSSRAVVIQSTTPALSHRHTQPRTVRKSLHCACQHPGLCRWKKNGYAPESKAVVCSLGKTIWTLFHGLQFSYRLGKVVSAIFLRMIVIDHSNLTLSQDPSIRDSELVWNKPSL